MRSTQSLPTELRTARLLGFRGMASVSDQELPGRQAADGSLRPTTKVWMLEAAGRDAP